MTRARSQPRHRRRPSPRSPFRLPGVRALLALQLGLLVSAAAAFAQGDAKEAESAAAPPKSEPKIETIPIDQVAVRSERAKRVLVDAQRRLESDVVLDEVGRGLETIDARFTAQKEQVATIVEYGAPTSAIDQAVLEALVLEGAFDELQAKLGVRAREVDRLRTEVARATAVWDATRAAAADAQASEVVLAQIDAVLMAARSADEQGRALQGRIVSLQSRVAQASEEIEADLDALRGLRERIVGRVFQRDTQPVWRPQALPVADLGDVLRRLREAHGSDLEIGLAFLRQRADQVVLHGVAFVSLVVLLLVGRARRMDDESVPVSDTGRVILDHPMSIAALLVLLGTIWTLPDAPRPLAHLRSLVLIVPSVVLLRRFLARDVHAFLYAVVGLWVLDRVRLYVDTLPALSRLFVFVQIAYVCVLAVTALRRGRLAGILVDAGYARAEGPATFLVQVMLAASVGGLAAELAGYHVLASIVAFTLAFAPIGAVVFWGAVRAVGGLVDFGLTARPLRFLGMVQRHRELIRTRIVRVVGTLAALVWFTMLLDAMQIRAELWSRLVEAVTARASVGSVSLSLGDVLLFIVTVWLSFALSRFLRFVLTEDFYPRVDLKKGQPYAFSTLTHYAIVTFGVLIAVLASGLDFDRLSIMIGALSVGVGFGLQTAVNNFVSGLILLTERPVEVGDAIALGNIFGVVERIGLRSTVVRTWQGAEIVVPNADLVSEQVTNWTRSDRRRRIEIPVHVAYGSDPERVREVLLGVANEHPSVQQDPEPFVLMMDLGDSSLDFELRAWTGEFDTFLSVQSELRERIVAALGEAGIVVPFPQRVVHMEPTPSSR